MNTVLYRKLHLDELTKECKKADDNKPKEINKKANDIASRIGISDRVHKLRETNSYVTVKDHKTDFLSNPKSRLINGSNQEISRISQKALKEMIRKIKMVKQYELWENSRQALNWFEKQRHHLRRECDSCDYTNNHTESIHDKTESIHDKTKHFKCDECNYKTTKCDGLKEHIPTVHQKVKKTNVKCVILQPISVVI